MKIYTISKCGECPAYQPDRMDYTEYGTCYRLGNARVFERKVPPKECPLTDIKKEI